MADMDTVKNFVAGTVGGVTQVLVGQPFDTVKVRLQSMPTPAPGQAPMYTSMMDCVRKTAASEGMGAFYKGTTSPLIGVGLCVAIQFAAVERVKNLLRGDQEKLTWMQHYLAGAAAGVANSVVSGPVEHLRTRMQVQVNGPDGKAQYSGSVDAARKIYKAHGLAGIYKGQMITLIREFQGYGGYFLGYEFAVSCFLKEGQKVQDLHPGLVMMCGAAGGYGMWLPVYPIDSIKSKIQTDGFGKDAKYKGMVDCAQQIYRQQGIPGFYRGFLPCLLRAAPVNASTFLAFELAMRMLGR